MTSGKRYALVHILTNERLCLDARSGLYRYDRAWAGPAHVADSAAKKPLRDSEVVAGATELSVMWECLQPRPSLPT